MDKRNVIVVKNNHEGQEIWRYPGRILERDANHVKLEAYYDRNDLELDYIILRRGDLFIEWHHGNRWYAIYEIHDVKDGRLKGWYCNFSRPAILGESKIVADDLALDLFVYPDKRTLILDRDEFNALPITEAERSATLSALEELEGRVKEGLPPFGC